MSNDWSDWIKGLMGAPLNPPDLLQGLTPQQQNTVLQYQQQHAIQRQQRQLAAAQSYQQAIANQYVQMQYSTACASSAVPFASTGASNYRWNAAPSYTLRHSKVKYHPNTLGWRGWNLTRDGYLQSPQQGTVWETPELHAKEWSKEDAVRGVSGIHALMAPKVWRLIEWDHAAGGKALISGLVERFGQYVLGEDGWRAEHVIVRELLAPDRTTAAQLRKHYPELKIHTDED